MIKRLHHVGIAVNNLDDSVAVYERLLGGKPLYVRDAPCQQARAAVFKVGDGTQIGFLNPKSTQGVLIQLVQCGT